MKPAAKLNKGIFQSIWLLLWVLSVTV